MTNTALDNHDCADEAVLADGRAGAPDAFKRVLVGVDGTSTGRDAIALGEMLRSHDGRLILAHVVLAQGPMYRNFDSTPAGTSSREMRERDVVSARVCADFTGMFAPSVGSGLHQLAKDVDADLMGPRHGRSEPRCTQAPIPGADSEGQAHVCVHRPKLAMNPHDRIWPARIPSRARPSTAKATAGSLSRVGPDGCPAPEDGRSARARPPARPRVDCLATGGTIASIPDHRGRGATPTLGSDEIVRSVPDLAAVADLRTAQFLQRPSTAITFPHVLELRDEIMRRVEDGSAGIVITQGTDTIEETAFALDVMWASDAPIVITGAMRNPSLPGADGPANLLAAVQLAASPEARGLGALVVFNDEIHSARFVAKAHTSSPSAFRSSPIGPLGWLSEGRPVIAVRPAGRMRLDVPSDASVPPVALVRVALDDDGRLLAALRTLGYSGAVIEGFGGGHVTPRMVPVIQRLAAQMPVVLASRTGSGDVLSHTYRYPGSEIELLDLGLVRAGALDGVKSRVLLSLCLAAGLTRDQIAATFETLAVRAPETGSDCLRCVM